MTSECGACKTRLVTSECGDSKGRTWTLECGGCSLGYRRQSVEGVV